MTQVKTWKEQAERLRLYAASVSTLGGMNDMDKALFAAADAIELLQKFVPKAKRKAVGGFE